MAEFGIEVRAINGRMINMSSGMRMCRLVQSKFKINGYSDGVYNDFSRYTEIPRLSPNSDVIINFDQFLWWQAPSFYTTSYNREGDGVRVYYRKDNKYAITGDLTGDVFELLNPNDIPDYGILLTDSVQPAVIGKNQIAYITYMETINFTGNWSLPSDFPYRDNSMIFAGWHHNSVAVVPNGKNGISGYIRTGDESVNQNFNIPMRIMVMSQIPDLQIPSYGIQIFNQRGETTFCSGYTPLCYHAKDVRNADGFKHYGINNPMVNVQLYGCRPTGNSNRTQICQRGLCIRDDGSIGSADGDFYARGSSSIIGNVNVNFTQPLLVIDGDRYF